MWRLIAAIRPGFHNLRKSHRVADESMFPVPPAAEFPIYAAADHRHRTPTRRTFSLIFSIVRAPFSVLSCFAQPHVHAADGFWVSDHFSSTVSDTNHLMVSDGMRYALLM